MHLTPYFDPAGDQLFTLKVRGEDPDFLGQPGAELAPQFTANSPTYGASGFDGFEYVPLDNPIPVEGTVFVGFVQTEARINIGLDKNTNTNPSFLWYTFPSLPWQQSEIEGSLMIRPVFRAGKDVVTGLNAPYVTEGPLLFPNPSQGVCQWQLDEETSIRVLDMTGKVVASWDNLQPGRHAWDGATAGTYVFVGRNSRDETWVQRWVMQP